MRSITGLLGLLCPATAFAATGEIASAGDGALIVIGIAAAALIFRRRRGLPDSVD